MTRQLLGTATAPDGVLVVLDMGYASIWEDGVEAPEVVSDHGPSAVPPAVDLTVMGRDAEIAAQRFDRQPGIWLYDVPLEHLAGFEHRFAEVAAGRDARLAREPHRIGLEERTARVAARGGGAFWVHGIEMVVVAGLPSDRPLELWMNLHDWDEAGERPGTVTIDVHPELDVASTQGLGRAFVDWAQLMVAAPRALTEWRHYDSIDGKCDVVFWGRDAAPAAAATGATQLSDNRWGWTDLDIAAKPEELSRLERWLEADEQRLIRVEVNPHSHHWQILEQAAAAPGGTIELAGARITGFFTGWGDGAFPVVVDRAADGSVVRLRIVLGDEARADQMRTLIQQQRHTLHHHQPIDRRFDSSLLLYLPGFDGERWEQLQARRTTDGYELACVPFMIYYLAYGDVVEWSTPTEWTVVRRSGHRVIRIGTEDREAFDAARRRLETALEAFRHEWLGDYYLAIDVPPGADIGPLLEFADGVAETLFEWADDPPEWARNDWPRRGAYA